MQLSTHAYCLSQVNSKLFERVFFALCCSWSLGQYFYLHVYLFVLISFLFFFSIFSPFFYHLPFSTPPSPICYFSPASPSALPSSDSVSRRRVERQKGVVRPRSTCWYSSCHKFSGQYWGACCCFSRGRRYRDQGENGWLGP